MKGWGLGEEVWGGIVGYKEGEKGEGVWEKVKGGGEAGS